MTNVLVEHAQQHRLDETLRRERDDAARREQIAELRRLLTAENHRQDALRAIRDMARLVDPPPLARCADPGRKAPRHTKGLVASDWHLGFFSPLGASSGMYHQSSAITSRQVREMWALVQRLHALDSKSKRVDELVVFSLGDLVEGDQMRPSQAAEVDSLVTQQTLAALDLLAWLVNQATSVFPRVRVLMVGGNHDRTSSKAGNAGLGELGFVDTYSWLIGAFLQRMFERHQDAHRLEIVNHESFFGTARVAGLRCVYEHGASFRAGTGSYGGVPYYPISNAATKYREMLDGADLVLMGHHHRALVLPMNGGWGWQVMNGALSPSSPYVQSGMKIVGRPTQLLLDLHHSKGLTGWHPLYLETPQLVRPGQFWREKTA